MSYHVWYWHRLKKPLSITTQHEQLQQATHIESPRPRPTSILFAPSKAHHPTKQQTMSNNTPPSSTLTSLTLTHVTYNASDPLSYLSAWLALAPQALCVSYATLIWATREAEIILMFTGQMACEALNFGLKRVVREERPKREFFSLLPLCSLLGPTWWFWAYLWDFGGAERRTLVLHGGGNGELLEQIARGDAAWAKTGLGIPGRSEREQWP
jgi:hypothetical protein